ncbi:hypothetical protein BaRGS_00031132 [Batillaria attramentaria]|uniref:Uncharacterized protein n=1 Tax=Batillaria attramentaria TaxID=370345 RepID=A0ABD0JSQ6_9CAEN
MTTAAPFMADERHVPFQRDGAAFCERVSAASDDARADHGRIGFEARDREGVPRREGDQRREGDRPRGNVRWVDGFSSGKQIWRQ